jgi:hypothetical protein
MVGKVNAFVNRHMSMSPVGVFFRPVTRLSSENNGSLHYFFYSTNVVHDMIKRGAHIMKNARVNVFPWQQCTGNVRNHQNPR